MRRPDPAERKLGGLRYEYRSGWLLTFGVGQLFLVWPGRIYKLRKYLFDTEYTDSSAGWTEASWPAWLDRVSLGG